MTTMGPDLDDPAHAARVCVAADALGLMLHDENYEQRSRAVLAVAQRLGITIRVYGVGPRECGKRTQNCTVMGCPRHDPIL